MHKETFFLDGLDAAKFGIRLENPVSFSEAKPILSAQTIPGRNGDLIFDSGSYENRSGEADCYCLQKDVEKALSSAGRFLMGKKGYRRLETSNDPNHFWLAVVENSPSINQRLRTLAPFTIDFDCKPQRFLKDGENSVTFEQSGTLYNKYGQIALPLITVYGQGGGYVDISGCKVEIKSMDGVLYLDSDTQNAYNNFGINQNLNINAPVFPQLFDGENQISFGGGVEKIEIIPRWWEL